MIVHLAAHMTVRAAHASSTLVLLPEQGKRRQFHKADQGHYAGTHRQCLSPEAYLYEGRDTPSIVSRSAERGLANWPAMRPTLTTGMPPPYCMVTAICSITRNASRILFALSAVKLSAQSPPVPNTHSCCSNQLQGKINLGTTRDGLLHDNRGNTLSTIAHGGFVPLEHYTHKPGFCPAEVAGMGW